MKNANFFNGSGYGEAWSNLNFRGNTANVVTVLDIIEDAMCGEELVRELAKVPMLHNEWTVDRETDTKVRIKNIGPFGDAHYIECEK